jgi:hypothetical protein
MKERSPQLIGMQLGSDLNPSMYKNFLYKKIPRRGSSFSGKDCVKKSAKDH